MVGTRTHGRNRSVECDQLQSANSRQMQQRGVGHLPVADDFRHQFGLCRKFPLLAIAGMIRL